MNKKSVLVTASAMALTAALTIGGTLALLSHVTDEKSNVFSSSKDVVTRLEEPAYGENGGADYMPGKVIHKDPTMHNDSIGEDIWVAVSLQYIDSAENKVSRATFEKYASIQHYDGVDANGDPVVVDGLNGTKWIRIGTAADGSELYMYRTVLKDEDDANTTAVVEDVTTPIFDQVTVSAGISTVWTQKTEGSFIYTYENGVLVEVEEGDTIEYEAEEMYFDIDGNEIVINSAEDLQASLPTFEISVKGYAVQASGLATAELAAPELLALANGALYAETAGFVAE